MTGMIWQYYCQSKPIILSDGAMSIATSGVTRHHHNLYRRILWIKRLLNCLGPWRPGPHTLCNLLLVSGHAFNIHRPRGGICSHQSLSWRRAIFAGLDYKRLHAHVRQHLDAVWYACRSLWSKACLPLGSDRLWGLFGGFGFCADDFPLRHLARLQGFGAAAAFASGMAALAQEFTGAARMRAFSIVGASFGVGLAFGPIASGLMVETFGWPSIFTLVVALAVIAFLLGSVLLRETRNPDASSLDWAGAVSFTLALTLFTYAVLRAPGTAWSDPIVVLLLGCAALLIFVFYRVERALKQPMLDLSLFQYPRFVGVQLLAAAPAYAFVVLLVLLPIRFVGIEGMNEVAAGRLMIALSGPLLVLPIVAGLLTRWFSAAVICGLGLLTSAVGLFWLSQISIGSQASSIVWPLLVIGIGISLPWGLMDGLAVSVVPKERAGMATGIFSTTRVAGEGVALAIVTAVLSALTQSG